MATYVLGSSTAAADVWYQWNDVMATTTAAVTAFTNNLVYANWIQANTNTSTFRFTNNTFVPPTPPTPEQLERQRREGERIAREAAERTKVLKEADKRAQKLLLSCLDDTQTKEYARNKAFRVRGSRGGVYEIGHGKAYQIDEATGRRRHYICIHGSGIPEGDNMLAKKLMLETDEEMFRRIGNFSAP